MSGEFRITDRQRIAMQEILDCDVYWRRNTTEFMLRETLDDMIARKWVMRVDPPKHDDIPHEAWDLMRGLFTLYQLTELGRACARQLGMTSVKDGAA